MIVNDFKIYCLKKNYMNIYSLLTKFQIHIYNIYKCFFITTTEKNIYINQIYELSKNINITYNNIILKYTSIENNVLCENLIKKYENNFDQLYFLIEDKYIKENIQSPIPYDLIYPLNNYILDSITNISNLIGFSSLDDFVKLYNINILIYPILSNHFKILKLFIVDKIILTSEDKENIKDSYGLMNKQFFFRVNNTHPNEIIVPYFDLIINNYNIYYVLKGVFYDDYLNLSSRIMTQVSFPQIFTKKKEIITSTKNFCNIINYIIAYSIYIIAYD